MTPYCLVITLLLLCVATGSGGVTSRRRVVRLRGAGASFPKAVYTAWAGYYKEHRRDRVLLDMAYAADGSSAGKRAMFAAASHDAPQVEYADSDYPLTAEEKAAHPDLKLLPTMAGAIVFGYNLDVMPRGGSRRLVLSMELVVGIYNGTYRYWSDPAFHELNANVSFPNEQIVVIARGDSSGTTNTLTTAFSTISNWSNTYGIFTDGTRWNMSLVTYLAQKNRGMSGMILSFKNSIGYLVVADAKDADLTYANMQNSHGRIVSPTSESVQTAMDKAAAIMATDLTVDLANHQQHGSYPIASFTYMIVRLTSMTNCESAYELVRYILWFTNSAQAQKVCSEKNMVPVSSTISTRIEQLILRNIRCKGHTVLKYVKEALKREEKEEDSNTWVLPTIVGVTIAMAVCLGFSIYALVVRIRKNHILDRKDWEITIEDIVFYTTMKSTNGSSHFVMRSSIRSLTSIDEVEDGYQMVKHILHWPAKWKNQNVGLRLLEIKNITKIKRSTTMLLMSIRDNINHNNVLNFFGLTELENDYYVVSDYCSKGPLIDLLKEPKYQFNKDCKFSLAIEIISGLGFLHSKGIIHGILKSSSCLVDYKWTVKIVDWEYCHLYSHLNPKKNPLLSLRKTADDIGQNDAAFLDFWTAPEMLRLGNKQHPVMACDVYSYGIIIQEIFTQKDPYAEYLDTMEPNELLKAILNNNLRPQHAEDTPMHVRQVMEYAWSEVPSSRPSCESVLKMLRGSHNVKKSVLDHMVEASEEYTLSLEDELQAKSEQFEQKEKDMSQMMNRLIPHSLQNRLASFSIGESLNLRSSVCVVSLRVVLSKESRRSGSRKRKSLSGVISQWMQDIDSRLTCIARKYEAFLINYTSGVYLLVYGVDVKEKRKAMRAAQMVFDFLAEEAVNNPTGSRPSLDNSVSYRCALHYGSVFTYLVREPYPNCHIMGEVVDEAYKLLQYARPSKVLVSRSFKEALSVFALEYFTLKVNTDAFYENGFTTWPGETYWLSRRPNTDYTKYAGLLSCDKGCSKLAILDQQQTVFDIERKPRRHSQTSVSRRQSASYEELPVTQISALIKCDSKEHSGECRATPAIVSVPNHPGIHDYQHSNTIRAPWESGSGKLTRSRSFTAGTMTTLRHFLHRTLAPAPALQMNVISAEIEAEPVEYDDFVI